jgi:hypothetical protein
MAADAGSFVAGHYTAGWGTAPQTIGTTESGFRISPVFYREDIRIDDYGDSIVDGIWRGYNVRVETQLSEWTSTGRQAIQNPFDTTFGTIIDIGKSLVGGAFAKQLVLTPVASINSANKTYTFPLCVPDGDHGGWSLNTRLRKVDIRLLVLVAKATGLLFTESA